jgi:pimeloyl-ACP methyl ester carboxylesterase
MKDHTIIGGGGARLHLVEAGNPGGRPIVFIHGCSQCSLSWSRQLRSDLARTFRLVAMDIRGHGSSEAPPDAYGDSRLWADDVNAVIQQLELDQPVLSGWSYGPLIILDYLRHYGEDDIGGVQFVGGVSKLGTEEALSALSPEFLAIVPALCSLDAETSVQGLNDLLRLCFAREPAAADLYMMLGYSVSVPPRVRQALLSRVIENDDLLASLQKPVLITHGAEDRVVRFEGAERHVKRISHAQRHVMPGAGHAPFWDDAEAFNERLATFCESAGRATHSGPPVTMPGRG